MGAMKPTSFILVTLLNSGGTFESVTKLQKIAFLAIKENNLEPFTKFKWHLYGPFSEEIQNVIDDLKKRHIISERVFQRTSTFGDDYTIRKLALTSQGREMAERDAVRLSNQNRVALFRTIDQYGDKPLSEILNYVYRAYDPEIIIELEKEKMDLGKFEQVSFDSKEDMLRKVLNALKKIKRE